MVTVSAKAGGGHASMAANSDSNDRCAIEYTSSDL
jgi:hypothetical protein